MRAVAAAAAATLLAACGGSSSGPGLGEETTTTVRTVVLTLEPAKPASPAVVAQAVDVLRKRLTLAASGGTVDVVGTGIEVRMPDGPQRALATGALTPTGRLLFRPVTGQRDVGDCPATSADRESATRPAVLIEQKAGATVACFTLGPSELDNGAVASAAATEEPGGGSWQVDLTFTDAGGRAFDGMAGRYLHRQIAIEVDGIVLSAPTVETTSYGGRALITGFGDETRARQVAVLLGSGPLPVPLQTRSAP